MSTESEQNLAYKMLHKDPQDVICAQFDFTKRQKLKGEWPSFLINVNNEEIHHLQPLVLGMN